MINQNEKHKLLDKYIVALTGYILDKYPSNRLAPVQDYSDTTSHCVWMLHEMKTKDMEEGKFFRWLGFVQGCLWKKRFYTIDQLREHNIELLKD